MSKSTPASPPLSPRQRLGSILTGNSRAASSAVSSSAISTASPLSPIGKDGGEVTPQSMSHDGMHRTRTHRLSRLRSPFKGSDVGTVDSPERKTSGMRPSTSECPLLDLPPTSSDMQGDYVDVAKTLMTPSALSRSSSYQISRPTSPSSAAILRSLSMQSGPPMYVMSPSTSPAKRTGPFLFNRSRKNSDVALKEGSGEGRLAFSRHSSRPASPIRTNSERSLYPYKRKSVGAPVIGLPTNFKHTSGISTAPLQNALQLAGLAAVSSRQSSVSEGGQTFFRPNTDRTSALLEDKQSLAEALDEIEKALDGMPARFTDQQFQRSPPPLVSQKKDTLDTVDIVSSGLAQRLDDAGQSMRPLTVLAQSKEDESHLSTSGDKLITHEFTCPAPPSRPVKGSLRSPSVSPVKCLHRKPVPKLEDALRSEVAVSPPQRGVLPISETNDVRSGIQGAEQLPDKEVAKMPPCISVKPSQDWSATLAEIKAALKA
ncbi:hypothetical protein BCV69DRAFT_275731 [Microstroma glucosiphilum]|uniref:CRIB domain-containing protein n=1 Tax=Pseudomicrostroma glucosiphilum TaxID=1684307 RepID=A0A316UC90_9BASI|nr:hypothetical protein BCV69DRAFT_275731 [Pseudomicrostroma glucosiphilum]PWN22840.1 hypothetical protein BCV69DRAFT_275731 [Pseudomicrostroma glucosiphilum]